MSEWAWTVDCETLNLLTAARRYRNDIDVADDVNQDSMRTLVRRPSGRSRMQSVCHGSYSSLTRPFFAGRACEPAARRGSGVVCSHARKPHASNSEVEACYQPNRYGLFLPLYIYPNACCGIALTLYRSPLFVCLNNTVEATFYHRQNRSCRPHPEQLRARTAGGRHDRLCPTVQHAPRPEHEGRYCLPAETAIPTLSRVSSIAKGLKIARGSKTGSIPTLCGLIFYSGNDVSLLGDNHILKGSIPPVNLMWPSLQSLKHSQQIFRERTSVGGVGLVHLLSVIMYQCRIL